jgi:acyl carrier protein
MSIRLTIVSQLEQVAKEQDAKLPPLSDDLVLLECGLDSLGFAILVARLEDALGFDPFSAAEEVYFPVTLGDFVSVYEHAAKRAAKTPEVTA